MSTKTIYYDVNGIPITQKLVHKNYQEIKNQKKNVKELQESHIDKLKDELVKKAKLEILAKLAANIAHDIKNPLCVIMQSVEVISLKTNQKETRGDFQRINYSIKRISHQIDQVLCYIMKMPLILKDTTVLTILKKTLDELFMPDNIYLEISKNDSNVRWDDTQISVLFSNVLLNAVQAIGKDDGKISVRISEEDETIIIMIEDTGPDVPEKDLEKIFEPLYTTKMEGTGLGLVGCKNIVQSHNGTITVSNNPVIFTITLPKIA